MQVGRCVVGDVPDVQVSRRGEGQGELDHLIAGIPGNHGIHEPIDVRVNHAVLRTLNGPVRGVPSGSVVAGGYGEMGQAGRLLELDGHPDRVVRGRIIAAPFGVAATNLVIEDVERVFTTFKIRFVARSNLRPVPRWIRGTVQCVHTVAIGIRQGPAQKGVRSDAKDFDGDIGCCRLCPRLKAQKWQE